jgi:hypothetical protein
MIKYLEISDRGVGKTERLLGVGATVAGPSAQTVWCVAHHITSAAEMNKKLKMRYSGVFQPYFQYNSCYTLEQAMRGHGSGIALLDEFDMYQDNKEVAMLVQMFVRLSRHTQIHFAASASLDRIDWDAPVTQELLRGTGNSYYSYDQYGVCSLINRLSSDSTARFHYAIKPRNKRS